MKGSRGRVVITYGTFDLLHQGHINLLRRARELGDYLIVGVTSESYDLQRGKLNVRQPLSERIKNVERTGLADLIIVEEYEGQKIEDIERYNVDIFAIGSDWKGKFDYLKDFAEVVYLERTRGISSTDLRGYLKLGIIGTGRIAQRFINEAKYVSGVLVEWVYHPNEEKAKAFAQKFELSVGTGNLSEFFSEVDAIYIATPHHTHYEYISKGLQANKHVLAEKPMVLSHNQAKELFALAYERKKVLLEAIKTAFAPSFRRIIGLARSRRVGQIVHVDATFTKLISEGRELDPTQAGGSVTELGSYVLLPTVKLLGTNIKASFLSKRGPTGVDIWTRITSLTEGKAATGRVGIGVKEEGDLVIGGTTGYIYVPAPWWKPKCFEIRREDPSQNETYCDVFAGDGLRYELAHFAQLIQQGRIESHLLRPEESIAIAGVIEQFLLGKNVSWL
ncbi:MAG: Gfo/Idh/MocA family oxidoreductase [Gammaproteobacteria bacterium]|nr:Gfo/Idh/MocA family oxidoreductase [Gammaproteobacteria bacterium]